MQRHGKVTGMKSDDFIANGDCGRLRSGVERSGTSALGVRAFHDSAAQIKTDAAAA